VFSSQSSVLSRQSHPGTDNCELKTDNPRAGSTLLKILSRITEPTSGRAETCPFVALRASSEQRRRILLADGRRPQRRFAAK